MSILVIGANGGVGQHLVEQLKEKDIDFTAGVRKESQVEQLKEKNIKATLIDVETDDIQALTEKFKGFDRVVFSVGSGGSTGADKTIIVDLDGAIKAIKASEANHVKQFVMVSTYDSRREAFDASGDLKPYTIAKHYADEYLKQASVSYTIVHPGVLLNDDGTNKIEVGAFFEGRGSIPREDVASVINEVVTTDEYLNTEFQIISGDVEIPQALDNFKNK
ncbi:oxidoreductase [Staphylococcus cohnii subsp. cohnii]|uniref:NAD(P)-binding oxidoreductase n=1 Tax=Staphylococcus TaxID=1279 RepID=UPI000619989B|nr:MULTISPECIES: NAD(P)-binding oxidoreductase [unclassified Staphylococcus]KKD24271.1 oxidoreductase [Staphylococcus cohnii subsp. cohnii]KKD24476.1 oxidoreductase [Staphylococcus cohnii subsp. cohnii]